MKVQANPNHVYVSLDKHKERIKNDKDAEK